LRSRAEAQAWAKSLSRQLHRPTAVLLSGDLGAGKTQFVKWMLEDQGVGDAVSPTFAVHQQYETPRGLIDHVDLYRLQSAADLEGSGFWDLLAQPQALLFVEWAERLGRESWPANWTQVFVDLKVDAENGEEARRVRLEIKRPSPTRRA
jgi:tRNA threonylcarbamoyladenosine biosynthesis protein TsaE